MENTIGLIFCSGYGKRLLPYTATTPKSILLKQSNKTFLEINIEKLLNLGIKKIFVSYSYGYNLFVEVTQRFSNKICLIREEHPVGQGKTICNLLPQISEYKYLYTVNGDTIMEYNASDFLHYSVENNTDFLISSNNDFVEEKKLLIDMNQNLCGLKTDMKKYFYTCKTNKAIYAGSLGDNIFKISALTDIYDEASKQDFLGFFGEDDLAEIMIKHHKLVKLKNVEVHSYHSINTVEEFNKFNKIFNA